MSTIAHRHQALHLPRREDLEAMAREGYRFYAKESEEFAATTAAAFAEILSADDDASAQRRPLLPMDC